MFDFLFLTNQSFLSCFNRQVPDDNSREGQSFRIETKKETKRRRRETEVMKNMEPKKRHILCSVSRQYSVKKSQSVCPLMPSTFDKKQSQINTCFFIVHLGIIHQFNWDACCSSILQVWSTLGLKRNWTTIWRSLVCDLLVARTSKIYFPLRKIKSGQISNKKLKNIVLRKGMMECCFDTYPILSWFSTIITKKMQSAICCRNIQCFVHFK